MSPVAPDAWHAGRALLRAARTELASLRRIRGPGARTARRIARARLALAAGLLGIALSEAARARTPVFVDPLRPYGIGDVGDFASAALTDLDGDGDLDVVVGEFADLFYFQNTGTRTSPAFGFALENPFGLERPSTYDTLDPTFGDVDGDGDLDAFVGLAIGHIAGFVNTGSSTAPLFEEGVLDPFGLADVGEYAAPAFADLDADGDLDVFVGEDDGNTIFFENTGTPSAPAFGAPVTNPFGLSDVGERASANFADLDGDGDLDALSSDNGGVFHYFANTGSAQAPAFAPAVTSPFRLLRPSQPPFFDRFAAAFGDLDADGDLDFIAGLASGETALFSNVGTRRAPAFLGPVPIPDVGGIASPTLGDVDGDGDLDALVGFSLANGGTILFRNTGTASAPVFEEIGIAAPAGLANPPYGDPTPDLADLDGDGDLDVLVGSQAGVFTSQNTGSALAPAFAAPVANPPGLEAVFAAAPTAADLDADGDLDAFVGNLAGETIHLANTGTAQQPAFAAPTTSPFSLPTVPSSSTPAFADVDGDGDLDFLTGESTGTLTFAENVGTRNAPAFGLPVTRPFGIGNFFLGDTSGPTFADVDADGDADLFVGFNSGSDGRTVFFANLTPACPGEREAACGSFETGSLSVDERKPGLEKLTVKLARGPALGQADFGDPTADDGGAVALCLYDDAGVRVAALSVRRAGETCGAKPCWKPLGKAPPDGKGFAYKDPAGEADGVRTIRLAGGPEGRTSVALAASNRSKKNELEMTTGIAAALASATEVIVQVHAGACHEVVLTEITKQEPDRFKAK